MEWIPAKDLRAALVRGHGAEYAASVHGSVVRNCRSGMLRATATKYLFDGDETSISELPANFWNGIVRIDWHMGDVEVARARPFDIDFIRQGLLPDDRLKAFRVSFNRADAEAMGAVFEVATQPARPAPSTEPPTF